MTTRVPRGESDRRREAEAATRRADANVELSLAVFPELFRTARPERPPAIPPLGQLGAAPAHHPIPTAGRPARIARILAGQDPTPRSVLTFYDRFARRNATNPKLQGEAAWAYCKVAALYRRLDAAGSRSKPTGARSGCSRSWSGGCRRPPSIALDWSWPRSWPIPGWPTCRSWKGSRLDFVGPGTTSIGCSGARRSHLRPRRGPGGGETRGRAAVSGGTTRRRYATGAIDLAGGARWPSHRSGGARLDRVAARSRWPSSWSAAVARRPWRSSPRSPPTCGPLRRTVCLGPSLTTSVAWSNFTSRSARRQSLGT